MANANPSGLGYVSGRAVPEPNLLADEQVIVRHDGVTVRRKTMTNGNIIDTQVFPGDFPNAVHERDLAPKAAPKKGVKSDG